jgi:hypothetical protein
VRLSLPSAATNLALLTAVTIAPDNSMVLCQMNK